MPLRLGDYPAVESVGNSHNSLEKMISYTKRGRIEDGDLTDSNFSSGFTSLPVSGSKAGLKSKAHKRYGVTTSYDGYQQSAHASSLWHTYQACLCASRTGTNSSSAAEKEIVTPSRVVLHVWPYTERVLEEPFRNELPRLLKVPFVVVDKP